jgi:RNA polymerase sigma-70 factor, ECF subfamily
VDTLNLNRVMLQPNLTHTDTENVSIDDSVLVERCRNGDTDAIERLILKYQDRIFNIILKMCQNEDDAAELAQDTFVKVIEKIGSFQGRSGFYTWLFRIAVNLTLNFCSRRVRLGFETLEVDGQEFQKAKSQLRQYLADENSPDPVAIAQQKELCRLLERALIKLDDSQRAIIVLRDIEGMSYEQIAGVLNCELGTVKSRLSRARGTLREILEVALS